MVKVSKTSKIVIIGLAALVVFPVVHVTFAASVDVSDALAHAEALYYEAQFNKAIELLLPVDELLAAEKEQLEEKIDVKLQLALAYVGLNDTVHAKTYFRELFALDSNHPMDPLQYSPKVVQLATEARAEQAEIECRWVSTDAEQQLGAGHPDVVLKLIDRSQGKCPALSAIAPAAADLFFKSGLEKYRKAQVTDALQEFRSAVHLDPKHELAANYVELTESKLEVNADRVLVSWRKDFSAGEFASAAKDYQQLAALSSGESVDQVRAEYRKSLADLVDAWNQACKKDDAATMEKVRVRVNELLPDPSLGEDLIAKMKTCTKNGCVEMNAGLALARLKTRVDPNFPAFVRQNLKVTPVTVRVKTRINEKGDVIASEPYTGNAILYDSVRAAVAQWKFYPVILETEARCVDTDIPIVINFVGSSSLR